MSKALTARIALQKRKADYLDWLGRLSDDSVAVELAALESDSPRKGTFGAWALRQCEAELDFRL